MSVLEGARGARRELGLERGGVEAGVGGGRRRRRETPRVARVVFVAFAFALGVIASAPRARRVVARESPRGAGEPPGVQRRHGVGDARRGRDGVRGVDRRRRRMRGRGRGRGARGGRARGAIERKIASSFSFARRRGGVAARRARGRAAPRAARAHGHVVLVRGGGGGGRAVVVRGGPVVDEVTVGPVVRSTTGEVRVDDARGARLLAHERLRRGALERGERVRVVGERTRRGAGRERRRGRGRGRPRRLRGARRAREEHGEGVVRVRARGVVVAVRRDRRDGLARRAEERLAVAPKRILHHGEPRGGLARVRAHRAVRARRSREPSNASVDRKSKRPVRIVVSEKQHPRASDVPAPRSTARARITTHQKGRAVWGKNLERP